jgi:outer membrane biosynthesis protein TonB
MHLAYRLAIVLCLSVPATGWQAVQQDPAGTANATGQAPAAPAPPVENATPEKSPAQKEKPQPEHAPVEQAPAEKPPSPAKPQAPAKTAAESAAKETTDAGSVNGSRKRRKRAKSVPGGTARKTVVREGGASEPAAQIAPGLAPAEATRQRHNAEQLLGATDDKLKRLAGRTLDAKQQETVGQIRNYMEGARLALKEGDVRRANTLAQKAHLLSEDLVRH